MEAAHAVDAATGRCRCRTDKKLRYRRGVWSDAKRRSRNDLHDVLNAARNVSTGVIGIVGFELRRSHGMALENAITKAGRKSLNLSFDAIRHIEF